MDHPTSRMCLVSGDTWLRDAKLGAFMWRDESGEQDGGVDTEQNVVLISIASVKDPAMAPKGKHCLHAYLPATEPFALWKGTCRPIR